MGKTDTGGEVDALDAVEYEGTLGIGRALTIDGGPGMAKIFFKPLSFPGTPNSAVDIAAAPVVLRNMSILGAGEGLGIGIFGRGSVRIEHCVISGFQVGIAFQAFGATNVEVNNTTLNNNGTGISVQSFGAYFARLTATHVRLDGNVVGMGASDNTLVFVSDSSASGNSADGFHVEVRTAGGYAEVDLDNVVSANNGNTGAVAVNSGAVVRLSNSAIDHNLGAGVVPLNGGLILSFGNNKFAGNAAGDGTINGPAVPK